MASEKKGLIRRSWDWLNEPISGKKVVAKTLAADVATEVPKPILKARGDELPAIPEGDLYSGLNTSDTLRQELAPVIFNPFGFENPQSVINAVTAHMAGQFQLSGQLSQALLTDPKIAAPLGVRCNAMVGLPYQFTPANDSEEAKEMAEMCRLYFRKWFPPSEHGKFHRDLITMGFARAQMIFLPLKPGENFRHPEIHCWMPGQYIWWYWDPKRNYGRWLMSDKQGTIEPVPGDGQWIFATLSTKQPWVEGLVMSLGLKFAERLSLSLNATRFGTAMASGKMVYAGPVQLNSKSFQQLLQTIASPQNLNVVLPTGAAGNEWKVSWVGPNAAGAKDFFFGALEEFGRECAEVVLGQNLSTEVKSGSHAAAKAQALVRQDILEYDAEIEANIIHEQILKPIAQLNYGNADLAPFVEIVAEPPSDLVARGAGLKDLAAFLQVIMGSAPTGTSPKSASSPEQSDGETLEGVRAPKPITSVNVDKLLSEFEVPMTETSEDKPAKE